jgi:hypothetical protein
MRKLFYLLEVNSVTKYISHRKTLYISPYDV